MSSTEKTDSKRIAIITGGSLCPEFVEAELNRERFDVIIAVDRGADFFLTSHHTPQYIVGDFDSIAPDTLEKLEKKTGAVIEKHPSEKDETDTELAILMADRMKASEIVIYGGTGTRVDHVLGNIQLLKKALECNIPCALKDPYNRIRMIDAPLCIAKKEQYGYYVSLIPFTPTVEKLTLRGMKYPLTDYTLHSGIARCVSNEIVEEMAEIRFSKGIVIVIEAKKD